MTRSTGLEREARLKSLFDPAGAGLEIGPGYNPLLPKSQGFPVETVDYATQAELREKYRDAAVDLARIEEPDYIADGRPLPEVIGKRHCYDHIVASHVIEHVPDLVRILIDCEALLKPDGALVLAIPDKRHCFDVLKPVSTTGGVLQAHLEGRTRHAPGAIFDEVAYGALRGGAPGWGHGESGAFSFAHEFSKAAAIYEESRSSPAYRDIHAWRFTPSSFRLIVGDLHRLGLTGLREAYFQPSVGIEFYAVLKPGGAGCPVDRLTLAEGVLAEERAVVLTPGHPALQAITAESFQGSL